ncbi:hypothetical protein PENNAL_c0997G11898, partial [Penicillium nalgiovense]
MVNSGSILYVYYFALSSPSLAEVFLAYPSPKSDVTHTHTDGPPRSNQLMSQKI